MDLMSMSIMIMRQGGHKPCMACQSMCLLFWPLVVYEPSEADN